ncbi:zinc finger protein 33B-like isoform X2 [Adelges cooleyi]|uniref:zinc finger protein 33B-like isoform X2 n=1 Tax=Adelges cooleyi TaxID=133065 RepID=UPI00218080F0|nr:zinc finger protein 33B-like isoform X2 [Adelges cooleyi]
MDDYNGTVIKIEEDEDVKEYINEALVTKPELNDIGETLNCSPTIHDSQKTIDGFSESKIKIEDQTDDNYGTVYKIDNDEELTETFIDIDQSYNSCVTAQNDLQKISDGDIYKDVCNTTVVKVEVDIIDGHYYESLIEIEDNGILDLQSTDYNLGKIQQFFCDICNMCFTSKWNVDQHITRSHSAHSSTQESTRKEIMKKNLMVVDSTSCGRNKKIDGCHVESWIEKGINNQLDPKVGNEEIREQGLFKCDICQTSYHTKEQITLHIVKSHNSSNNQYSPQKITVHRNNYTYGFTKNISQPCKSDETPYRCTVCYKSYSIKSDLTIHELVHAGDKPYKCALCSLSFYQNFRLKQHERVHSGVKSYKCTVCLKSCYSNADLIKHNRVHTGEKPFQCLTCLKSFTEKYTLTQHHKQIHSGERPYQCAVCLKSFYSKSHLKNHKRMHTKEKPYKCTACSKAFSEKSNLKVHERVHSGEKPYECAICSKSFYSNFNLT